jgi:ATP-dependent Zn protease
MCHGGLYKLRMSIRRRSSQCLRCTAFHEAGHAVVAEVLGRRVKLVQISRRAGLMRTEVIPKIDLRSPPRNARERRDREREVVIYFAGLVAEEGLTGKRNLYGIGSDFSAIHSLLRVNRSDKDDVIAAGGRLYNRTVSLVFRNRPSVERVAEALVQHRQLSGRAVRHILRRSRQGLFTSQERSVS